MRRLVLSIATLVLAGACGGTSATPSPTAPPPTPTEGPNLAQAAVATLKDQHATWTFTFTTYESGSPNFSRTVAGTQSEASPTAVSFTITQSGKADKRYVRIGTDVWDDTGAGTYTKSKSSDNYVNTVFQPFFFDTIVGPAETEGFDYQEVGADTVSGIAATHYRLPDTDIEGIIATMPTLTPPDFAADVWTSNADGSLLRLQWGPQSVDKAQFEMSFDFEVTALDCDCPIQPPLGGGS